MNEFSSSETRNELLYAIKNRVSEITSGELDKPVYINNVTVQGPDYSANNLYISSIFCSSDNTLCGDLLPKEKRSQSTIMFGRTIEELSANDLNKILNFLYTEKWSVDDSEDNFHEQKKFHNKLLNRIFRIH